MPLDEFNRYRGGRKEKIFLKITYSDLARLFNRSRRTIKLWVSLGYLNPYSLEDIIEKYNNPNMLDKRRKCSA